MSGRSELGRRRADVLWDMSALVATAAAALIGLALVVAAWVGASGEVAIEDQFAWLNFGVAGVVLPAAAGALWIMQGRRAVGRRLRDLLGIGREATLESPLGVAARTRREGSFVAVPAMTRYHVPSCLLVQGKGRLAAAPGPLHQQQGRRPCELCVVASGEAAG